MQWPQEFLRGLFGFQALLLLPVSPVALLALLRVPHRSPSLDPLLFLAVCAGISLLGALFALTWWRVGNGKPHARELAIASSFVNLLAAFPLLYSFHGKLPLAFWLLPAAGIAGVFAFTPRQERGNEPLSTHLGSFWFLFDHGQLVEAGEALSRAEASCPDGPLELPAGAAAAFVFGNALVMRDTSRARVWWQRLEAETQTRPDFDFWSAHSALAWIEGDLEEAEASWRKARLLLLEEPNAAAHELNLRSLALLRQEIDDARSEQDLSVFGRVPNASGSTNAAWLMAAIQSSSLHASLHPASEA